MRMMEVWKAHGRKKKTLEIYCNILLFKTTDHFEAIYLDSVNNRRFAMIALLQVVYLNQFIHVSLLIYYVGFENKRNKKITDTEYLMCALYTCIFFSLFIWPPPPLFLSYYLWPAVHNINALVILLILSLLTFHFACEIQIHNTSSYLFSV